MTWRYMLVLVYLAFVGTMTLLAVTFDWTL